ncbi:MAG TPA: hypothetical protein VNS88_09685 [Nitrospiraceae bacterium]|nr:hypothetical protein [Nitrospiraceae bacterium]
MANEDDFWDYSSELALVRKFAHSKGGSPWAYLGAIMARAVTMIPYNVVMPGSIGGRVSTGLYVALVGDPGQGKGTSTSGSEELMPCDIHIAKLGSGEGIIHQYAWRDKGDDEVQWYKRSILFESSEAETMKALANRRDATLMGEVRSAWMSEAIGFGYSDVRKRLILPKLSYRLSVLATFTPSLGSFLLDGIAEGTPQRFLFLPVNDPNIPDRKDRRDVTDQIILRLPSVDENEIVDVKVPKWIRDDMIDAHTDKSRRDFGTMTDEEMLETHSNLLRLKVAFALGIILNSHRRDYRVTADDWDLSDYVMGKHRETRDKLMTAAEAVANKKDKKEGKSLGVRYAASDEIRKVRPVEDRIMEILAKAKRAKSDGWVTGGKLRAVMSPRQREVFDGAISALESQGRIESEDTIVTINNHVKGRRHRAR